MGKMVYLAILDDRHIDTQIEVCSSLCGALRQLVLWRQNYRDWYSHYPKPVLTKPWDWPLRWNYGDDLPKMKIQRSLIK